MAMIDGSFLLGVAALLTSLSTLRRVVVSTSSGNDCPESCSPAGCWTRDRGRRLFSDGRRCLAERSMAVRSCEQCCCYKKQRSKRGGV